MPTLSGRFESRRGETSLGITSFKCPNCKKAIPVSLVTSGQSNADDAETILVHPVIQHVGRLTVLPDANTPEQHFPLVEGEYIIGRKSSASGANIKIETADRSMSREHIRIEVKKMNMEAINITFQIIIARIIRYIIAII